MTNRAHAQAHAGSSLFQARSTHDHIHLHSHQHVHDQLKRDSSNTDNNNHIRFPHNDILTERDTADSVVVVETISVVQIIDGSGAVIEVSTILSDAAGSPATQASPTAATGDAVVAASIGLSLSLDLGVTTPSATAAVSDSSPSATDTADTVHVTNTSSSSLSDEATLTSAPLSSSTGLPSLPLALNSTTSGIFTNNTLFRTLFANSTTTSGSSSTLFSSSTDSFLSSVTFNALSSGSDVATVAATETANAGQGGDAAATATADGSGATSTAATASSGLPKETQNAVIGGVVGGLAGMALIVFLAMVVLRWKRQQKGGLTRLRDRSSSVTGRALPPVPGGGGDDASLAMTQRSAPFMIPSALATLTGYKRASQAGSSAGQSTGEKGFYRVSGKKLMPVLQSGGDGYSDPRDSRATNLSFYRDSQGYFGGSPTLQLGSPMRPESGVPIMRSGPGRTPLEEQGPFSDHAHPLTPPPLTPPVVDPLGRSLISQDGSRGSGSRFTEEI